jgi:hypothetical protein
MNSAERQREDWEEAIPKSFLHNQPELVDSPGLVHGINRIPTRSQMNCWRCLLWHITNVPAIPHTTSSPPHPHRAHTLPPVDKRDIRAKAMGTLLRVVVVEVEDMGHLEVSPLLSARVVIPVSVVNWPVTHSLGVDLSTPIVRAHMVLVKPVVVPGSLLRPVRRLLFRELEISGHRGIIHTLGIPKVHRRLMARLDTVMLVERQGPRAKRSEEKLPTT